MNKKVKVLIVIWSILAIMFGVSLFPMGKFDIIFKISNIIYAIMNILVVVSFIFMGKNNNKYIVGEDELSLQEKETGQ